MQIFPRRACSTLTMAGAVAVTLLTVACEAVPRYHGYTPMAFTEPEKPLSLGMPRSEVLTRFGTPTVRRDWPSRSLYYITSERTLKPGRVPQVTDRAVMALYFNQDDSLKAVKVLSMAEAQNVEPNTDTTHAPGGSSDLLSQVLRRVNGATLAK